MVRIVNDCVGCYELGLHCMPNCNKRYTEVHYCDRCDEEIQEEDIFVIDGEEICYECRLEMLEEEECLECCI